MTLRMGFPVLALTCLLAACGSAPVASSSAAPASTAASEVSKPAASVATSAAAKPAASASAAAKPVATGSASAAAKPAASAAAKPAPSGAITLAIPSQAMPAFPLFIDEKQGFYQQDGLQVERTVVAAGAPAIATGVISNSINVALSSATPILAPSTVGQVVILATPSVRYPYSVAVKSDIQSLKDLQGKTVGVSAVNGQDDLAFTSLLAAQGLPANAVKKLAIGGGMPARLAAMQAGQIDASMFSPPYDLTVQRQGFTILSHVYDDLKTPVAQDVFYTQRGYAQSHHAQMVGILRAWVEALRWGKANPDQAKALINQWVAAGDDQLTQATYDAYFGHEYEMDPSPSADAVQTNITNEAAARGEQPSLQASQVIDASYMKEALAALPPA
ncbi:MAG: ABC transporter substrate-binding protein [Chloroflexi bacterium]|nr:ABC transporter substrate-binding protein [Chloroflexota bacterium]